MKKTKVNFGVTDEERRARIQNGSWIGRNAVYKSKKDYNRQRERNALRKEIY